MSFSQQSRSPPGPKLTQKAHDRPIRIFTTDPKQHIQNNGPAIEPDQRSADCGDGTGHAAGANALDRERRQPPVRAAFLSHGHPLDAGILGIHGSVLLVWKVQVLSGILDNYYANYTIRLKREIVRLGLGRVTLKLVMPSAVLHKRSHKLNNRFNIGFSAVG